MLLQAINLQKSFGGRMVVSNVSFHVGESEIVGLLGRNGAGKTTSFRMCVGMIDADAGQVIFDNRDVTYLPMFQRARLGMGYLSQEPSVFRRLTFEQNLLAILETLSLTRAERHKRARELLEQFGLTHVAKQMAYTGSGGEKRKLEIARALVTQPKLILLDEPFSGVDPIAVEDLQREIRRLAEQGIACLITDHNVQQTLRVCHRACIIDEGKKFAEGTPRELINNEFVKRVYLGSLFRGDEFDDHPPHVPPHAQVAPAEHTQPHYAPPAPAPRAGPALPPAPAMKPAASVSLKPGATQTKPRITATPTPAPPRPPAPYSNGQPNKSGSEHESTRR